MHKLLFLKEKNEDVEKKNNLRIIKKYTLIFIDNVYLQAIYCNLLKLV